MDQALRGMRVAVLVADGFERDELLTPSQALEREGAVMMLIAPRAGRVQAMDGGRRVELFEAGLAFESADPDEFDGLLLPGGAASAEQVRAAASARDFAAAMQREGKAIAALSHGISLLLAAGLVAGRRMTGPSDMAQELRDAGGEWTGRKVVVDDNWVLCRGRAQWGSFVQKMIEVFALPPRGWINPAAFSQPTARWRGRAAR